MHPDCAWQLQKCPAVTANCQIGCLHVELVPTSKLLCLQVRVWVPAAVMRRAQATMVQGIGPGSSGLTLTVRSDFQESGVPLQVSAACLCAASQGQATICTTHSLPY